MKLVNDFGVRALLATIIVIAATVVLSWLAIGGSDEALIGLVAELSTVVGFYFGQRSVVQN